MSAAKKRGEVEAPPPISSLFREFDEEYEQVDVGLPPLSRTVAAKPVPVSSVSLADLIKVWMLIGRGGSGKTMLARWLADKIAQADLMSSTTLAALDPTNRTLARFFDGVAQPVTADSEATAAFLRKLVKFSAERRFRGVWDFGGGDLSLAKLIAIDPKFDRGLAKQQVGAVAAYVLTPAIDDLSILASFEASGFTPEAVALVLNMDKAPDISAFNALRAQNAYKAAIARGAVEIIMPSLEPQTVALEIERRRLHFSEVRDEVVPDGQVRAPIDGIEAMMVRDWLARMDAAFTGITSWLPWN